MAPPVLVSLGFLNSLAFNNAFGRIGPFSVFVHESAFDYFYWGWRSAFGPIIYIVLATVVVAALKFALRLAMFAPAIGPAMNRVRDRAAAVALRIGLDDPVVLAQALATLGIVAIALVVWWFLSLTRAWTGYVNTSPTNVLRALDPNNPDRGYYRIVLTLLTAAIAVGLARVIKLRRDRRTQHGTGALVLLVATVAFMVVLADFPYRLFSHSEGERVDYNGLRCYDIGQSGDEVLIYCPETNPPRNQVVKRSDPSLHRLGIVESVFTLPPSTRP